MNKVNCISFDCRLVFAVSLLSVEKKKTVFSLFIINRNTFFVLFLIFGIGFFFLSKNIYGGNDGGGKGELREWRRRGQSFQERRERIQPGKNWLKIHLPPTVFSIIFPRLLHPFKQVANLNYFSEQ